MRRAPEGPEGTGGLRGAAPNEVRPPSLAGGRALRRPEHPWGHKQQHAARTAAGPGCGARGRWRGLAGLRDDAPNLSAHQEPLVRRAPEGPEGTGGLRGAAPNEVRPPSLAGGRALRRPEHQRRHKQQHGTGARARRPAPPDATTQTRTIRSTCVRSRSAHAARQSRRSSRSLRLRQRAGPRR